LLYIILDPFPWKHLFLHQGFHDNCYYTLGVILEHATEHPNFNSVATMIYAQDWSTTTF